MSEPSDILEILQTDITAILEATPALADAVILADNEGDIEAKVARSLAPIKGGGSNKSGLAIIVLLPEIVSTEANLPGPPLSAQIEIQVIEQVLFNRSATGTGLRSSAAALIALNVLHHHVLGNLSLYAEKDPIAPLKLKPGYVSHVITLLTRTNGITGPGKPSPVQATLSEEDSTITIAGTGSSAVNIEVQPAGTYNGKDSWTANGQSVEALLGVSTFVGLYHEAGNWTLARNVPGFAPTYLASAYSSAASPIGLTLENSEPIGGAEITGTLVPDVTGFLLPAGDIQGSPAYTTDGNATPPNTGLWVCLYYERYAGPRIQSYLDLVEQAAWWSNAGDAMEFPDFDIRGVNDWYSVSPATGAAGTAIWNGDPILTPSAAALLTLTSSTDGAEIYYTTDGSYPASTNEAATLYEAPFTTPPVSTFIRTAAYLEGLNPSDVTQFTIAE